jgi:hypothetical protein
VETQAEVVGPPYHFHGTDDGTRQNDDMASFGYDSPHESLADIAQGNTHPNSYYSSSKSTFIPGIEDEEEDDDFFGVDLFDTEEEASGLQGLGPDEGMPEFLSPTCHHQGQRAQTYKEMDKSPPVHDAGIEWSALELASLELLSLCDNSGARCGFYDELLTLLRRFQKKRSNITKAKGCECLLKMIGLKVSAPAAKVTMLGDHPIVYFPFLDSLRDLLLSTTFDDRDNLCINKEEQDCFKPFKPVTNNDYGELMVKDWARDLLEGIEDFDAENDLFLAVMMYSNKTGTNMASFGYDSPHESLADIAQGNTHPNSYYSSSKSTFIPGIEDEEEDDDFFGVDLFDTEEEASGLQGLGPDEGMPEFLSPTCHHQGQRAQTYKEMDKSPPVHDAGIEWSALELASLELLSLCDNSGARCGFYDELLTLLRWFQKKRINITKAKGCECLLKMIGLKVSAPAAKVTMVGDCPIVYFPFLDSLRDLLLSTTFDDLDNLCINKEEQDCFKPFKPVTNNDYGELMVKDWERDLLEGIEDFDAENDLFLAVMMYSNKTGTNMNQRYPFKPWMFTVSVLH